MRQVFRTFSRHRPFGNDDEFIAADAGDHGVVAGFGAEPLCAGPDDHIAGGMTEVIVDGLQPVQIDVERCDGTGSSHPQSATNFRGQRSTIVQTGQFVVLGQPMQAALRGDTALQLCEQRRNHSEYIEFFGCPAFAAHLVKPRTPVVTVPQSRGATAVTDARPRRAANRLE